MRSISSSEGRGRCGGVVGPEGWGSKRCESSLDVREWPVVMSRAVAVLYGSQTGSARDVAEDVARQCSRRGLEAQVSAMDDYDVCRLPAEQVAIIIASTTGQVSSAAQTRLACIPFLTPCPPSSPRGALKLSRSRGHRGSSPII